MLVGVFLRHYKIFRNINYIPLSDGYSFSSIIGDNGVGKSTVLEALDIILNHGDRNDWNINKPAQQEGGIDPPYIVPVFLIEKEEDIKGKIFGTDKKVILQELGEYFWTSDYKTSAVAFEKFYDHRDRLLQNKLDKKYHLLVSGKTQHDSKLIHFGPYQTQTNKGPLALLKKAIGKKSDLEKQLCELLDDIIDLYKYIYFPVDIDFYNYSKLESESMQYLMDRSIHDDIKDLLEINILNDINDRLDSYINNIQSLMDGYVYDKIGKKYKLTKKDLADKAIEAYFSIKALHKQKKKSTIPIDQLSSGEKRKALIDLAYSFLKQSEKQKKKVILAIDEPESSINISSCYDQFEKVKEISNNNQVLITTHWYGFLPIMMDGQLVFLSIEDDNTVRIESLKLGNVPEELKQLKKQIKGPLPFDVQIKSRTDLVQSIISSLQADKPYNWLICEGSSEKIYMEYFLKDLIASKNLRVLPVGGKSEVKKFYNYLVTPISDSDLDISGKVICLIDTDEDMIEVEIKQSVENKIKFFRLLQDDDSINLVKADSNKVNPPTEIEDALNATIFKKILKSLATNGFKKKLVKFKDNKGANISAKAYDLTMSQRDALKSYFKENRGKSKMNFAKQYVEKSNSLKKNYMPDWIEDLRDEF